jgi:hypothetical protein
MGFPAGGGRNELDCCLRDELDDVELLRRRLGPPLWKSDIADGRADPFGSSCFGCTAGRFPEDLSDRAKQAFQLSMLN